MCGRYRLTSKERWLLEHFGVSEDFDWSPRFNIALGQQVPVIRQDTEHPVRHVTKVKWGLIPLWAKEPNIGYKMINAKSETILEKPAYREAFKNRRCLVPADGFYEWQKQEKAKQPFCFVMNDDSVFVFAGIWERWKNPQGETVETCSILTTAANSLLADVHDRMPVIVHPDNYVFWLSLKWRTGVLR